MEYSKKQKKIFREVPLNNFKSSISIFSDASWINDSCHAGLGFLITLNENIFVLAGTTIATLDSPILAEVAALILALDECIKRNWWPSHIFTNYIGLINLVKDFQILVAWHLDLEARRLFALLRQL